MFTLRPQSVGRFGYLSICGLLLLLLQSAATQPPQAADDCGCDHLITQGGIYRNSTLGVRPGQTVCIQAGHYESFRFMDFVGLPDQPIRFINYGGQVTIGVNAYYSGIQILDSRHFILSGSGVPGLRYGIKITDANHTASVVNVSGRSSNFEIERIEVAKAGFAGIMVKADPGCDSTMWRPSFAMYDVKIHDNYVHDTGAEGLYIGSTSYNGVTVNCNGVRRIAYPHLIYGLEIYNNLIERTSAEGLQYACAPDAKVHDNFLRDTGLSPFESGQSNGLQVGSGGGGEVYNNTILNARGAGLIVLGHLGENRFYNNVIANSGGDGIFCDDRPGTVAGTTVYFLHNTIHNSGRDGIRLYNDPNLTVLANNAISGFKGRGIVAELGARAVQHVNLVASDAEGLYTNPAANVYRPVPGSRLINLGTDANQWGIYSDRGSGPRPIGGKYDIGAYEYPLAVNESPERQERQTTLLSDDPRFFFSNRGNTAIDARRVDGTSTASVINVSGQTAILACGQAVTILRPNVAGPAVVVTRTETPVNTGFRLFPVPCRGQLTVELPELLPIQEAAVYSLSGQCVLRLPASGPTRQLGLSTEQLAAGSYWIRITTGRRAFTGRFVKL